MDCRKLSRCGFGRRGVEASPGRRPAHRGAADVARFATRRVGTWEPSWGGVPVPGEAGAHCMGPVWRA